MLSQVRDICQRFGIPESVFEGLVDIQVQDTVFVATKDVMSFDLVRPMRRGLRFCRMFPRSTKPATFAMQVLGRSATRNCIEVGEQTARQLVNGSQAEVEAGPDVENGFVLIRCRGFVLGTGMYKRPHLKSQIPKYRPVEE